MKACDQQLHKALDMARRALAVLEEQAADYGSLEVPVSLRIQLEDKLSIYARRNGRYDVRAVASAITLLRDPAPALIIPSAAVQLSSRNGHILIKWPTND